MKKNAVKYVCVIVAICALLMILFNCMVKSFEVKGAGEKWSVHFFHFFRWDFDDFWSGYLICNDADADAGNIVWESETYGYEAQSKPSDISDLMSTRERIALGFVKQKIAYYGPGIHHDDTCGTINITWTEKGQKMHTTIEVDRYI